MEVSGSGPTSEPAPVALAVQVTASPQGATIQGLQIGSPSYSAGATGWLTATLSSMTTPSELRLQLTSLGLPVGQHSAQLTVGALTPGVEPTTLTVRLTVGAAVGTALAIGTQPAGAVSGLPLETQPVIEVRAADGSRVPSNPTIAVRVLSGGGTLTGTTSIQATDGVAVFTDLGIEGSGEQTLEFTSQGLSAVSADRFAVIRVVDVRVSGAPEDGVVLRGGEVQLEAQPVDENGDPVRRVPVTWTSTNNDRARVGASGLVQLDNTGSVAIRASALGVETRVNLSIREAVVPPPPGAPPVTADVAGGGVTLTIPGGSTTETQLTVTPASLNPQQVSDPGRVAAETVYEFGPAGTTFAIPITLSLKFNPARYSEQDRSQLRLYKVVDRELVEVPGSNVDLEQGEVRGQVQSFSLFTVAPPPGSTVVASTGPAKLRIVSESDPGGAISGSVLSMQPAIEVLTADDARTWESTCVRVSIASGNGTLRGRQSVCAALGVARFDDLRIDGFGPHTLTFSAEGLTPVTSDVFTVAQVATSLQVGTQPSGAVSGQAFATQPAVRILDGAGLVISTGAASVIPVTAGIESGTGTLRGTTTATAVNGVATFSDLRISGSGSHTLAFTAAGLPAATSASFSVAPGVASTLSIRTQPLGGTPGTLLRVQPVVELRDLDGNLASTATNAVTVAITSGEGGTLGGTLTVNAVNGVATFANVTLAGTVGTNYTLTFTSEGLTPATSASVTLTALPLAPVASVTVTPGTASITVGNTAQLTATPRDPDGGALTDRTVTWSSSNTAVATVSGTGLVTGVAAGTVTITATSEGQSGTASVTVTPVPVASVAVTPGTASITVGNTAQLAATPRGADGVALTGRTVTWSSSNTAVATVSATGLVTGVAAGTVTITATSEGQSGTASVTVTPVPVASVAVTPETASIEVGTTAQLTATPRDADGGALAGRTVTWSSSNTAVAQVSITGLVTGVAAGTVTITATSEGQSGTAMVTVTALPPAPVASVSVTPETASITVGNTAQLTATPRDADGGALTDRTVTWTSSNTAVATVSATGLVTGGAAGTVTITATSEGQSGTASVTVTALPPAPVASVAVTPETASITVGNTAQLTATPRDASGGALTDRTVTWSSSNTAVATVSATGLVTGVAAGTVTITATSEGQSGTASVTVTAASGSGIRMAVGESANASATVGQNLVIPIRLELEDRGSDDIASVTAIVTWDPALWEYVSNGPGNWVDREGGGASVTVNATGAASQGTLQITGFTNEATLATVAVRTLTLRPKQAGTTTVAVEVTAAGNVAGQSILPRVAPRNLSVTITGAPSSGSGIRVAVGERANASATVNQSLVIPIRLELEDQDSDDIASVTAIVTWDTSLWEYVSDDDGNWEDRDGGAAFVTVNATGAASQGTLQITGFTNEATLATVTVRTLTLRPKQAGTTTVAVEVTAAGNVTGQSILPRVTPRNLSVTISEAPPSGSGIRVGLGESANASGTVGQNLVIPLRLELEDRGSDDIASVTAIVTWDTSLWEYVSDNDGNWEDREGGGAFVTVNATGAATQGTLQITGFTNEATLATVTVRNLTLRPKQAGTTTVAVEVTAAGNAAGQSILPRVTPRNLSVTVQ